MAQALVVEQNWSSFNDLLEHDRVGRYERARSEEEIKELIEESLPDGDSWALAKACHKIGVLLHTVGKYEAAAHWKREALDMLVELHRSDDSEEVAFIHSSLAVTLCALEYYDQAVKHHELSLRPSKHHNTESFASRLLNFSNTWLLMSEYDRVLEHQKKSLEIMGDLTENKPTRSVLFCCKALEKTLRKVNSDDEADHYQEKAAQLAKIIQERIPSSEENIGNIHPLGSADRLFTDFLFQRSIFSEAYLLITALQNNTRSL